MLTRSVAVSFAVSGVKVVSATRAAKPARAGLVVVASAEGESSTRRAMLSGLFSGETSPSSSTSARRYTSRPSKRWPAAGRPPLVWGVLSGAAGRRVPDRDLVPLPSLGLLSVTLRRVDKCRCAHVTVPTVSACLVSARTAHAPPPSRPSATALVLASPVLAKTTNPAQFSYGG